MTDLSDTLHFAVNSEHRFYKALIGKCIQIISFVDDTPSDCWLRWFDDDALGVSNTPDGPVGLAYKRHIVAVLPYRRRPGGDASKEYLDDAT